MYKLVLLYNAKIHNSTLREKCPYSELFWSSFFRIQTEYGGILRFSPYSFRMRENAAQNNSEYGHFLRSGSQPLKLMYLFAIKSVWMVFLF